MDNNELNSSNIHSHISRKLFVTTIIAMVMVAVLSIILTLLEFNNGLRPALLAKAQTVSGIVKQDVEYALAVGVPFESLSGVNKYSSELIKDHPEISKIVISGADSSMQLSFYESSGETEAKAVFQQWDGVSIDQVSNTISDFFLGLANSFLSDSLDSTYDSHVVHAGKTVALVEVYIDNTFVNNQMTSVFFDTLVILFSVSLIALEIVVVASSALLAEPLRKLELALKNRADSYFDIYEVDSAKGVVYQILLQINLQHERLYQSATKVMEQAKASTYANLDQVKSRLTNYRLGKVVPEHNVSTMDARIPLFVFCFAEELQKSFLPLFVAEFYQESDWFEQSIMMGLPISSFMFVIALLTPFAAKLVEKYGQRNLFIVGLLPALLGHIGCYFVQNANDILVARSITAIGYAVITISCQSYFISVLDAKNRAKGMATFVGVFMAGTMCGTAIGAILADWLGYKPVFLVATTFVSLAGVLGYFMLSKDVINQTSGSIAVTSIGKPNAPMSSLLKNRQIVMLILFCAIPTKMVLTGFLYLFVPIYLASLDVSQSEIGRIMMMYSLVIIPLSPLASRFADRFNSNLWLVAVATAFSGIALFGLSFQYSAVIVLVVVALLGVAHSFIKAPLIVAVLDAADSSGLNVSKIGVLSLLRTSERVGSVLGPIVIGALLLAYDFSTVAVGLGVVILLVGCVLAVEAMGSKRGEYA